MAKYDPDEFFTRKKPTNADRIRAMSDEELAAEFVVLLGKFGFGDIEELLDWLRSPAEGEK